MVCIDLERHGPSPVLGFLTGRVGMNLGHHENHFGIVDAQDFLQTLLVQDGLDESLPFVAHLINVAGRATILFESNDGDFGKVELGHLVFASGKGHVEDIAFGIFTKGSIIMRSVPSSSSGSGSSGVVVRDDDQCSRRSSGSSSSSGNDGCFGKLDALSLDRLGSERADHGKSGLGNGKTLQCWNVLRIGCYLAGKGRSSRHGIGHGKRGLERVIVDAVDNVGGGQAASRSSDAVFAAGALTFASGKARERFIEIVAASGAVAADLAAIVAVHTALVVGGFDYVKHIEVVFCV